MFYSFEVGRWKCSGEENFSDISFLMIRDQQWVGSSLNEVELYRYVPHVLELSQKYCILGKTELILILYRYQKTNKTNITQSTCNMITSLLQNRHLNNKKITRENIIQIGRLIRMFYSFEVERWKRGNVQEGNIFRTSVFFNKQGSTVSWIKLTNGSNKQKRISKFNIELNEFQIIDTEVIWTF